MAVVTQTGYMLAAANTISIILTLLTFYSCLAYQSFRSQKIAPSWSKLRYFQLGGSGLIVCFSVVHCGLIASSVSVSQVTDPVLTSNLFLTLTWIVLLLGLIDLVTDARLPHALAWTCTVPFEAVNLWLTIQTLSKSSQKFQIVDIVVLVLRVVTILALLGSFLVSGRLSFHHSEDATAEETQPLLGAEAGGDKDNKTTTDAKKKDDAERTGKNEDDDDEEQDEDDDEDEDKNEEEEKAVKELRARPWKEYIASYKIFLPHIVPRSKRQYLYLLVMCACTGITRVLNVLLPLSLGALVNNFGSNGVIPWKELSAYLFLSVIAELNLVGVVEALASSRFSARMKQNMDVFCYNHIMQLSADFHDGKNTAGLGRAVDRGDEVISFFDDFFFHVLPMFADMFISIGVLLWLFGAYVCFIVATTIVFFTWSNIKLLKQRSAIRRKYIDAWCAPYDHMWESQYNWQTVSHFNQVNHEKNVFDRKVGKRTNWELYMTQFRQLTNASRQLFVAAGFLGASIMAVKQIAAGRRQVGDFVMLVTYWGQVMSPVNSLVSTISRVTEQLVDAEKLLVVLEKKPTVRNSETATELDFQGGAVTFENVSFSYDGERVVSEGINFETKPGQTIALVGETGGGKSTILKLLFRFYDPKQGRILIDGQDIKDVKLESLRALIGIVPQDPAMFSRSVYENVRYPNQTATEEEVTEACKGAVLHDKIMTFAKGYKTKVGERGAKLSGGEAQRLAIARAIIKKPKMLLLDEATSAVDSVTEQKIQACLSKLCEGRTTFIIAHRLSTILHADKILVIKGGKLLEVGSHRDLIKKEGGAYRELWSAQLKLQAAPVSEDDMKTDKTNGEENKDTKSGTESERTFVNDLDVDLLKEVMPEDLIQDELAKASSNKAEQDKTDTTKTDETKKDKSKDVEHENTSKKDDEAEITSSASASASTSTSATAADDKDAKEETNDGTHKPDDK